MKLQDDDDYILKFFVLFLIFKEKIGKEFEKNGILLS